MTDAQFKEKYGRDRKRRTALKVTGTTYQDGLRSGIKQGLNDAQADRDSADARTTEPLKPNPDWLYWALADEALKEARGKCFLWSMACPTWQCIPIRLDYPNWVTPLIDGSDILSGEAQREVDVVVPKGCPIGDPDDPIVGVVRFLVRASVKCGCSDTMGGMPV
ncbi:MAG: hypothetical protein HUU15_12650 [Candidatus Brocadiae bacterium]|nr:hypothetical protein [Candidatus Brocadiia bacterium]